MNLQQIIVDAKNLLKFFLSGTYTP